MGEGAEKEQLVSLARSRGLTNLRFVDQQSRERIPAYICASDACLVLLKKTEIFKTVIPSKMLEFMSCARPVILGVEGQAQQNSGGGPGGNLHRAGKFIAVGRGCFASGRDAQLRETLGRNGRRHICAAFFAPPNRRCLHRSAERVAGKREAACSGGSRQCVNVHSADS